VPSLQEGGRGVTVPETIDLLRRLQAADEGIRALESELEELPRRLELARQDLAAVEAKVAGAQTGLDDVRKKRRDLERDIAQADQNVLKFETDKIKVKTNEEFRALNHQIALEKERKSGLEDRMLVLFDEEEEGGDRVKKLKAELEVMTRDLAAREADTRAREEDDRHRLGGIRSERDDLARGLEERLLSRYENIRTRKGGIAVVAVARGACGGCHTQQPPQKVNEIRKEDALHTCDFCGRFLVRPLEEAPAS
jgi:uncharacterized protein